MNPSFTNTDIQAEPDKLGITLFLAAAVHGAVILGVSFKPFLQEMRTPPSLEVILVEKTESEKPEEADYLAQTSQDGGGESDDSNKPSAPFVSQQDFATNGVAPTPVEATAPKPVEKATDTILTSLFATDTVNSDTEVSESTPEIAKEDAVLIEQNLEIARLMAEINAQVEKMAKRPKKKVLNARTQEASAADYMYHWVEKVERIGNINYPDAARRKNLTGSVVVVVGIFKNGDIESVTIEESSGHKLLDDATLRFIKLGAPFAPLTGKLAEETDILYIVRTLVFQGSNSITSY